MQKDDFAWQLPLTFFVKYHYMNVAWITGSQGVGQNEVEARLLRSRSKHYPANL